MRGGGTMTVSNVRRVLFGAVIGATGIALAAPFSQPGIAAAASATAYAGGTTGVVSPSDAAPAAAGQTAVHAQRGVRTTPRTAAAPSNASAPAAVAATASLASSLLQNFNGTSSNDSRRTNFNQEF